MLEICKTVVFEKKYPIDTMEDVIFSALSPNKPSGADAKRFSIETMKPEGVLSDGVHKMWASQSPAEFVPVLKVPFLGESVACYEE